jgi:hypothetical protein
MQVFSLFFLKYRNWKVGGKQKFDFFDVFMNCPDSVIDEGFSQIGSVLLESRIWGFEILLPESPQKRHFGGTGVAPEIATGKKK